MPAACLRCRKDKKKCSGTQPKCCTRCSEKGIKCEYPEVARMPRLTHEDLKRKANWVENKIYELGLDKLDEQQLLKRLSMDKKFSKMSFISENLEPMFFMNFKLDSNAFCFENGFSPIQHKSLRLSFQSQLIQIYVDYIHPSFPFLNNNQLLKMQHNEKVDEALLNAILCKSYRFLQHSKHNNTLTQSLDSDGFYLTALQFLEVNTNFNSLEQIQAEIIIGIEELGQALKVQANQRVAKVICRAQVLELHNLCGYFSNSLKDYNHYEGKLDLLITWAACLLFDNLVAMFLKKPTLSDKTFFEDDYSNQAIKAGLHFANLDGNGSPNMLIQGVENGLNFNLSPTSTPLLSSDKSDGSPESLNSFSTTNTLSRVNELHYFLKLNRQMKQIATAHKFYIDHLEGNIVEFIKIKEAKKIYLKMLEKATCVIPPELTLESLTCKTLNDSSTALLDLQLSVLTEVLVMECYFGLICNAKLGHKLYSNILGNESLDSVFNIYQPKMLNSAYTVFQYYQHKVQNYWDRYSPGSLLIALPLLYAVGLILREFPSCVEHPRYLEGRQRLESYLVPYPIISYKLAYSEAQTASC